MNRRSAIGLLIGVPFLKPMHGGEPSGFMLDSGDCLPLAWREVVGEISCDFNAELFRHIPYGFSSPELMWQPRTTR